MNARPVLRLHRFAAIILPLGVYGAGCDSSAPYPYGPGHQTEPSPYAVENAARITPQHLEGTLASVQGVATDRVEAEGDATFVRFDVVDHRGWMMANVNFDPPLLDARWAPGTTVVSDASVTAPIDAPSVTGYGCSGPARGDYTFDRPADRIRVRVEQGSTLTARRVFFTASWDDANGQPGTVSGSFEVAPN